MTALAPCIENDRGLGTAYERWCFYQRMQAWAQEYGVQSVLEGPLDGMAGIRSVHSVGLARQGVRVVAAVRSEEARALAERVYARAAPGGHVEVRVVADEAAVGELPPSDMVLVYHALPFARDWRKYLATLGALATKLLVVATCNPHNWGFTTVRWLGGPAAPPEWTAETLAPALWSLGRVREHVYFDAPWWPDLPVAPGQSLTDRLKQLAFGKGGARFSTPTPETGARLAAKYVYGPERWPYFGGPGWLEELEPALLRHPAMEGASERVVKRMAHLHAFVVDRRPRTPQARRGLAMASGAAS
jgi:hypothetical protein